MRHHKWGVAGLASLAFGAMTSAAIGQVTFSGSSGSLAGSAQFSVSSGNLVVVLTNTATADVLVPADILCGVFFNISGASVTLNRQSALLTAGSTVFYDPEGQPAGGIVGGEWAYRSGITGAPGNRSYGISSSGFNLFGPPDLFPGPDLSSPTSPNGINYGILSAGDNSGTGNTGVTGSGGLIKNSVTFTLSGAGAGFDLNRIQSVWLQYGTDLAEPGFQIFVPAPGTAALLAAAGVVVARRRRPA